MTVSTIIICIMTVFMCIGAIDKAIFGNRLGYGEKFEEGLNTMGPLTISMVGIMCLAPVIGEVLTPVISPIFQFLGADPAMFAGTLLAIDMGGYPLAQAMTTDQDVVVLSGIILGSMLGCTIVFSIPVAVGMVEEKDKIFLAQGMMLGIIAIPFGTFIGGLTAGMSPGMLAANLIPALIVAVILALGLWFVPKILLNGFQIFSCIITAVIIMGLACGIVEGLTGFVIIPGMEPIGPQLEIIGIIAITLAGAYPFVAFITSVLAKPLKKVGGLLHINEIAVAGMIASLANSIPTFGMLKEMDNRGKVLATAFAVPGIAALGDHLGYAAANAPEYIVPMVTGKITGAVIAVFFAIIFLQKENHA